MVTSQFVPPRESYTRDSVLEYLLIGDLRDLLEEPPDAETRRWLLAVLDELLDLLPNEFEYEDDGGYLSDVCEQNPNWSDEVDRLHDEHDDLFYKLLDLRNRIVIEDSYEYVADEVRPALQRWTEAVQQHRDHEKRLVLDAYELTFGGEG